MAFSVGLGRDSPILLEGDPKKYEGLILRHGQWVRWMSAHKCPCVLSNNRPDPRCPKCRGIGWRYTFQEDEEDYAIEAQVVDEKTIELPYEIDTSRVRLIQDGTGAVHTLDEAYGRWLRVVDTFPYIRGLVYVSVVKDRTKTLSGLYGRYIGHGIVQVNKIEYQGPWAKVPIDIISAVTVTRGNNVNLPVLDSAVDKISIDTSLIEPVEGEALNVTVTYMPPYRIAIMNQAISRVDQRALQEVGGDALALFPYAYKVSEQDIITSWASTQVRKRVIRKAAGEVDILPDLFVSRILHLEDGSRVYTEGTHYVIWDRNTIRWIVDSAERPTAEAYFSIEYEANATYRVLHQFPNIRAAEDKRFPQRVGVKLESGITGGDQV